MRRNLTIVAALLLLAAAGGGWLTRPVALTANDMPAHRADVAAGERIFHAGGCASCHATPVNGKRAQGQDKLRLGGGLELDTPFGVFRVPNISPDAGDGIGQWTTAEFVTAMQLGTSPDGRHYYPAFPYTSYARMKTTDVLDLGAYLATLPKVAGRPAGHSLRFPWSLRQGIGLWKWRYLRTGPVLSDTRADVRLERGRALVEGAGHCGECHTERDAFGGLNLARWLGGAASAEGEGTVPNITPGGSDIATWSQADIAYYLESGFTPEFDTVGGAMVAVQENLALLSAADREAIAAYLKAIPALD